MGTDVLGGKRLVRDDPDYQELRPYTSADDLLPRTYSKAAKATLPGFKRCASAETSTGWVTPDEFLSHRQFTRKRRCFSLSLPKLMSSLDDYDGALEKDEEPEARPTAHQDEKHHDADLTPLPSSTASTAFTPTSSSSAHA
jgi:hypothetical protein